MSTAAGDRQNAQMAFLHVSRELHRACDASEEVSDKLRFAVGAEKRQLLQQLKVLRQKRTLLLEYLLVMRQRDRTGEAKWQQQSGCCAVVLMDSLSVGLPMSILQLSCIHTITYHHHASPCLHGGQQKQLHVRV